MPAPDVRGPAAELSAQAGVPTVFLPTVVHEASAAVLVVDLLTGQVTYANDLAVELAPDEALPVSLDRWAAAAELEYVTGPNPTVGPFDPVAPVLNAQPVRSLLRAAQGEPIAGAAVTAARATSVTASREPLSVLGLPLTDAPDPMSSLALLVFLPLRHGSVLTGAQEPVATVRDRAVLATRMSFTITDPRGVDHPLVWVNPAFTQTTGYSAQEVIGRNCRLLQGPETDPRVVAEIRENLEAGRPFTATLLNYRKDGTQFWNELSVSPVRDGAGTVTHFVGVQADVTARVEAQNSRDHALVQAASAADRLALLADFTSQMATSRTPRTIVEMLVGALVPRVATWGIVYTLDEGGRLARPVAHHERATTDSAVAEDLAALIDVVPEQLQAGSPVWRVLDGSVDHVLIPDFDGGGTEITGTAVDDRTSLIRKLGVRSIAVVPLLARSGILGCVALVADSTRPPLGYAELSLLRDLSARAGLMLENAQLYAHQRAAVAALQRSLLPRVPTIAGIDVAARYVPSVDEAAVGGDWYDVFPLRDEGVGVVVGDVMGHNYDSAARMGKLSTIVRAYAWPGAEPQAVLGAVDDLLTHSGGLDILATCMLATLRLDSDGAVLRYSSAGHPPAIVRMPDGSARTLDGGRGTMIGVSRLVTAAESGRPPDAEVRLPSGAVLICFTDGLVDAYAEDFDIDAGLAQLCRITESIQVGASPRQIVDRLTAVTDQAKDDVAVVAIRIC